MEKSFGKDRRFIMGIAVLLIVFLHTDFILPGVITYIRRLGYIQVDTFMLLSGYGLYYSYKKNTALSSYYGKRLLRVLPTYWILTVVYCVFIISERGTSVPEILGLFTGTSLWVPDMGVFSWFAQFILFVYFISPILIGLVDSKINNQLLIILAFLVTVPFISSSRLMIAVARIPVFLLGMIIAQYYYEGKNEKDFISVRMSLTGLLIGICLLFFFKIFLSPFLARELGVEYYILFWPAFFIAPGFVIILSTLKTFLSKFIVGEGIVHFLECIGESTFEIYLFQSLFYMLINKYFIHEQRGNFYYLVLFICSIAGGIILNKLLIKPIQLFIRRRGR